MTGQRSGRLGSWSTAVAIAAVLAGAAAPAAGQQANVGIGYPAVGTSYYESVAVQWGLRGNGWFFNFGGPPPVPMFGGYDPGAGANFGFSGPRGYFNLTAAQGSSRSLVGTAPSVTVMNGGTGYFSDSVVRPFVTGFVPVVGAAGPGPTMLDERLSRLQAGEQPPSRPTPQGQANAAGKAPAARFVRTAASSTAERGDLSVAQIKAEQAAKRAEQQAAVQAQVDDLLEKAHAAEEAGKLGAAQLLLKSAARRAGHLQQAKIAAEIDRLQQLEAAAK
jgi:hypothetical protein